MLRSMKTKPTAFHCNASLVAAEFVRVVGDKVNAEDCAVCNIAQQFELEIPVAAHFT